MFSDSTGTTNLGWDPMGRLTSAGSTAGTVGYSYNAAGERTGMTQPEGATPYSWDSNSDLVGLTDWRGDTASFNNDADGRMLSATLANGVSSSYGYDGAGRLISLAHNGPAGVIDSFNYTLDNNGNRIAVYDPWGQLTEATLDGTTTTAAFDATGTRVEVDGVDQLWDRTGYGTLISTSSGDNYLHMPGGGVLRYDDSWLLRDAVGSVRTVTDTTGTVTDSSAFTVFGEPRATGSSVFGFAGEQTDPNTLIHLRARGYNPAQGTFTSYDPVQPGGPSTAGWNHYTYTANNPTTWSDPTGEAAFAERGLLNLAIVAVAVVAVATIWIYLQRVALNQPVHPAHPDSTFRTSRRTSSPDPSVISS